MGLVACDLEVSAKHSNHNSEHTVLNFCEILLIVGNQLQKCVTLRQLYYYKSNVKATLPILYFIPHILLTRYVLCEFDRRQGTGRHDQIYHVFSSVLATANWQT